MPLMDDWSRSFIEALTHREPGVAMACGLSSDSKSGAEFERKLGLLLEWQRAHHLAKPFAALGSVDPNWGLNSHAERARTKTEERLLVIMETLNTNLYEQFGLERIDASRAKSAYQTLLHILGDPELAVATTNYDASVEVALKRMNLEVDTGFRGNYGEAPVLQPHGMVGDRSSAVPVIHLHGAVGWYEVNGRIESHYRNKPFNPTLGRPVVLYPDPLKDPARDATVNELWNEFRDAVNWAEYVLVLGHSLHDPALVRELNAAGDDTIVAVIYLDDERLPTLTELLPKASFIHLEFGPNLAATPVNDDLARWLRTIPA
jgi:hypothetical protein